MDIQRKDGSDSSTATFLLLYAAALAAAIGYRLTTPSRGRCDQSRTSTPASLAGPADRLADSTNSLTASRPTNDPPPRESYTAGIAHFKAGRFNQAMAVFDRLANHPNCSHLLRCLSLNMLAQVHIARGDTNRALSAFHRLAELSQRTITARHPTPVLARLFATSILNEAQIYQLSGNYAAAAGCCEQLLAAARPDADNPVLARYLPLARDRLTQFYLSQGNIDGYISTTRQLVADYPSYYRAPLVQMENAAVEFLAKTNPARQFRYGSFDAPALAILQLRRCDQHEASRRLRERWARLCTNFQYTYPHLLLQYHYGWLLDAMGEKEKAAALFKRISTVETDSVAATHHQKKILENIRQYAGIQAAIIMGEQAHYNKALKLMQVLRTDPNNNHASALARAVKESLITLKCEVSQQ